MRNKRVTLVNCFIVLVIFCSSLVAINPIQSKAVDPHFTLVYMCGGGILPDYGKMIKQDLSLIGINIDVIVKAWPDLVAELLVHHNYDLTYLSLTGGGGDPDFTGVYNQNGSLNIFGYDILMDYDPALGTGINEWYIQQGALMMPPDSEERIQHYWDWEQYLMDKICPLLPMFVPKLYKAHWANLLGYNLSDGILQSWGKMSWDGLHTGQNSTNELVISDAEWENLNPLNQSDISSAYISRLCIDPLIWFDNDLTVWPHLAKSYTYINDTTILIEIRDGIYWPDKDSFTKEPFDINDVYFTFYAWKHLSDDQNLFTWIEDMKKVDNNQLYIYVDGNETTPENEPYAPSLAGLARSILPEHYLNQTQLGDGITPDTTHASWTNFSTNCFGTGLFELSNFIDDYETTLTVRPGSWWLNTSITNDPLLNWEQRFGDFTGGLTQHRIRVIPDSQSAIAEFEEGKIDIISVTSYPDKKDQYIADLTKRVQSELAFHFGFLAFNMRIERIHLGDWRPSSGDPSISRGLALRKAICYAIDRERINDELHDGSNVITHWPIYQRMGVWCNPNIIRYDYDLLLAQQYFDLLGYNSTDSINMTAIISTFIGVMTLILFIKKKKK